MTIWTPEEAANFLRVKRTTVIEAARFGRLPSVCWFKVGRQYRFRAEELMHMRSKA